MRLAFLGTPQPAVVALRALVEAGHDIVVVVTRADARRHRHGPAEPSPVKAAAIELGLPVGHEPADVVSHAAQLGVVVAYGRLIRPAVLAQVAMVNLHFSLLPRWRGAAPVERAILAGDATTGVCLMDVEEGLDTGALYRRAEVAIGGEETAAELTARLAALGAAQLTEALGAGLGDPSPQVGEATYAAKLTPAERELIWSRPAADLHRVVRVGRAWTTWRAKRLLVLGARVGPEGPGALPGELHGEVVGTGRGGLRLLAVQPEGRPPLSAADWLRGTRPVPGERLGP